MLRYNRQLQLFDNQINKDKKLGRPRVVGCRRRPSWSCETSDDTSRLTHRSVNYNNNYHLFAPKERENRLVPNYAASEATGCICRDARNLLTKALSTLSQKSATVAEFGDCRRCLAVFGDSRTFLWQCGQGLIQHSSRCSNYRCFFDSSAALFQLLPEIDSRSCKKNYHDRDNGVGRCSWNCGSPLSLSYRSL